MDWIKVSLVAGTTYQFDADGLGSGEGTLSVSCVRIARQFWPRSHPVRYSGGPLVERVHIHCVVRGDYFISEQALSSEQLGTYKISVAIAVGGTEENTPPTAVADAASVKEDTAPNPVVGNVLSQ